MARKKANLALSAWYLVLHALDQHSQNAVVRREDLGDGSEKAIQRLLDLEAITPTDAPDDIDEDEEDEEEVDPNDDPERGKGLPAGDRDHDNRDDKLDDGIENNEPPGANPNLELLKELKDWRLEGLRKLAGALGLPATGTKGEILGLLTDADPILLETAYLEIRNL